VFLLGMPAGTGILALDEPQPDQSPLPDRQALTALAETRRPAVAQVVALAEAAEAGVGLAKSERRPELGVGIEFDELQLFGAASLEFPLIDFGSIRHAVRASRASAEAAKGQVAVVRQQLAMEVDTSLSRLDEATSRLRAIEADQLPRRRELLDGLTRQYDGGAVDVLDVIDARRAFNRVREEHLQARLDVLVSLTGLERTVGVPFREFPAGADGAGEESEL